MNKNEVRAEQLFFRAKDIAQILGISRASVYMNLVKSGLLPEPIKLDKISLWKKEDVETLIKKLRGELI